MNVYKVSLGGYVEHYRFLDRAMRYAERCCGIRGEWSGGIVGGVLQYIADDSSQATIEVIEVDTTEVEE